MEKVQPAYRNCTTCKQDLPRDAYAGRAAVCRVCKAEADRNRKARSSTRPGRETTDAARERKRRWQAANADPFKMAARIAVNRAIKAGVLVAPANCESCGKTSVGSDGRRGIQAHHHLGYDKPLDVEWLCPRCHRAHDDAAITAAGTGGGE